MGIIKTPESDASYFIGASRLSFEIIRVSILLIESNFEIEVSPIIDFFILFRLSFIFLLTLAENGIVSASTYCCTFTLDLFTWFAIICKLKMNENTDAITAQVVLIINVLRLSILSSGQK